MPENNSEVDISIFTQLYLISKFTKWQIVGTFVMKTNYNYSIFTIGFFNYYVNFSQTKHTQGI